MTSIVETTHESLRVKICGLTNFADAECATSHGAWALGFILTPKSPRHIKAERVGEIVRELKAKYMQDRDFFPKIVGVFLNQDPDWVLECASKVPLDLVQLHGDELPSEFKNSQPLVKVVHLNSEADISDCLSKKTYYEPVQYLLVDQRVGETRGGTGQIANWQLAAKLKSSTDKKLVLAGGLKPSNIKKAFDEVAPYACDLSSGVEDSPGIKSHEKIIDLFRQLRKN